MEIDPAVVQLLEWFNSILLIKNEMARQATMPEDFLIDQSKAMARLDISEPTIKRWRKAGILLTVPMEGTDLVRFSNNYITSKMISR